MIRDFRGHAESFIQASEPTIAADILLDIYLGRQKARPRSTVSKEGRRADEG
jgi:hypothetical protein